MKTIQNYSRKALRSLLQANGCNDGGRTNKYKAVCTDKSLALVARATILLRKDGLAQLRRRSDASHMQVIRMRLRRRDIRCGRARLSFMVHVTFTAFMRNSLRVMRQTAYKV